MSWTAVAAMLGAAGQGDPPAAAGVGAWLDVIIGAVGLSIAALFALRWLVYVRRDPLAAAPPRPNRLGHEAVFIGAGSYILAASLFAMMFPVPGGAPGTTVVPPVVESPIVEAPTGVEVPADQPAEMSPEELVRTSLLDSLAKVVGTAVCFWLAIRAFDGGLAAFLFGRSGGPRAAAWGVAMGIAALPLCYLAHAATLLIFQAIRPDYEPDPHTTIQLLLTPGQSPWAVAALYLGAGFIAPLGEEVFFRGFLQTSLGNALRSRWIAILLASACFAAVHAQLHALPALFLLSVLMGFVYERTGSLLAPFLVHAIFNGKTLLWSMLWP
jgi:membrane protease YdiL (CAAX protease family)